MKEKKIHWTHQFGISACDALRLSRELLERAFSPELSGIRLINHCRDIILQGSEAVRHACLSVSFAHAAKISLQERAERRTRTIYEITHICRRLQHARPALESMRMRDITSDYCRELMESLSLSDLQFIKVRAVLHSVFSCAVRHGWCSANPVDAIPRPTLHEAEVEPLPWHELLALLRTSTRQEHRCCMPALGIMLWAGVRPAELMRLTWEDIDWQEKVICIRPRHSKTGGCRHITLHSVLLAWFKRWNKSRLTSGSICPPNWIRRWKALRRAAGILHWQQDVLRHTFASYHLKRWHDLALLQEEMGHRSARLLRTRYLSMKGITRHHALLFWSPGKLG